MLPKTRVLVPFLQASQSFLGSFSGNGMNMLVVLLWMSNAFAFEQIEGKTSYSILS